MQSTRYLAPLIECARRKNHLGAADRRGMREAVLQRQFWQHLSAFVEEARRAEVEQLHRERCAGRVRGGAAVAATPGSPAAARQRKQHHHLQRQQAAGPEAERATPMATAPDRRSKATKRAHAQAEAEEAHGVLTASAAPHPAAPAAPHEQKRRGKVCNEGAAKSEPHTAQQQQQLEKAQLEKAQAQDQPLPLKKRRRANSKGERTQDHSQQHGQQGQQHGWVPKSVTVCQQPLLYTIVRCGSGNASSGSGAAVCQVVPNEHMVGQDAIDVAAREFMQFLAQRQSQSQSQQQQQQQLQQLPLSHPGWAQTPQQVA